MINWTLTDGTDWDHLEVSGTPPPTPPSPPLGAMLTTTPLRFTTCHGLTTSQEGAMNPVGLLHITILSMRCLLLTTCHLRPAFILGHEKKNPGEAMGRTVQVPQLQVHMHMYMHM